jgi:hypothetical protein
MSKILRRPLFRGGSINSRGTGITSGLTEEPRVRKAVGGSFLQNYILGPKFGGVPTNIQQMKMDQSVIPMAPGASEQDRLKLFADLISEQQTGDPLVGDTGDVASYLTGTDLFETAYGSRSEEADDLTASLSGVGTGSSVSDIEASEGSIPIPNKETKKTDDFEVSGGVAKVREGETAMDALFRQAGAKKDTGISRGERDDTDINLEDIFAERIKRAKRGDIADILLGASEGFFEEGTLMGGAKGAVRAGRAPSRTEQAKQSQENILIQKAFAESKSKGEFEQAVKLLGIKGDQAKELAKLYADLGIKGSKVTDRSRALSILRDPDSSASEQRAAKEFLNIPFSVASELAESDIPGESAARIAASNVYGKDFQGTIDLSNIQEGQDFNPGVYIDTEQKIVIKIDEDGKSEIIERY